MNWCFALACLLAPACRSPDVALSATEAGSGSHWVRRSQPLLGSFAVIAVHGPDPAPMQEAVTSAFAAIREVDGLMSVHRQDSELSRVNREAAHGPVQVSPELFGLLQRALALAEASGGAFDITIRPLADLWGFIWKEYRLPTAAELAQVLPHVNHRLVRLDESSRTVEFLRDGVSIDLGGIAKGYAVDRAVVALRGAGVTNALVRIGGDLRVTGHAPGVDHWEVQLEDPSKQGHRRRIRLRDAAVSTAGDYENYFVVEDRRYSHLLDPRTGLPVRGVASCSVVAPTCEESDGWSTALFVMGPEEGLARFGRRWGILYLLEPTDSDADPPARASSLFPELLPP